MSACPTCGARAADEVAATSELKTANDLSASLRELLDMVPDVITLSDESGFFYVSQACRAILGYEPEELVGAFRTALFHEDDIDAVIRAHTHALDTDGNFGASCRLLAKDGHYVWLESRGCAARKDADGCVTAIEAIWRDVSKSMSASQERARTASLLEAANARLAETLEREHDVVEELRKLDLAKTDFVSTVSHELRTPLTSIIGYVEILSDEGGGALDPGQTLAVQVIERNSRRLRSVIENLLTISSVETGALSVSPAPTHFGPIIESAVSTVRPAALEQGIELTANVPADLPAVWADPSHADRIVLNLLSNAIKFTPPGGHVEVSAAPSADGVTVTVRDDGMGIPDDEQTRLFERFSRGSAAAEQAIPGSGLGLFIVKRIVELHGGTVSLHSSLGEGTEATITLPLVPEELTAGVEEGMEEKVAV